MLSDVLPIVASVATIALTLSVTALVVTMLWMSRRRPTEAVDTPQAAPEPPTAPTAAPVAPAPMTGPMPRVAPTADYLVTEAPIVEGVTLREWMLNHHPLRDGVWGEIVRKFYTRAAQRPEIADYFRNTNMEQLQRHFTRALAMVSGSGLSAATLDALAARHARVTDSNGRPITTEVYDAVIRVLIGVLREVPVPEEGIAALAVAVEPLRAVIAHPAR